MSGTPSGVAARRVLSVSQVAARITKLLASDPELSEIAVRGEVAELFRGNDSRLYFSLKDQALLLKCVAWKEYASALPLVKNGDKVIVTGSIATYRERSTYQLRVTALQQDGIGDAATRIALLRKKLGDEGLFDSVRKVPMPRYPFRVALISSRSAQGFNDFVKIQQEHAAYVAVEIFESSVQGARASSELVNAIRRADLADIDLIFVVRGGGSPEDLLVFSEEPLVREIASCRHPLVTAIGHEYDVSLADLAADAYAKSPSDAAHTFLRGRSALVAEIAALSARRQRALSSVVATKRSSLAQSIERTILSNPREITEDRVQVVNELTKRIESALGADIRRVRLKYQELVNKLQQFDPISDLRVNRERLKTAKTQLANLRLDFVNRRKTYVQIIDASLSKVTKDLTAKRHNHVIDLNMRLNRLNLARRVAKNSTVVQDYEMRLNRGASRAVRASAIKAIAMNSNLTRFFRQRITDARGGLLIMEAQLLARSPEAILERGYAIVRYNGMVARSPADVPIGAEVEATLAKGSLTAIVTRRGDHGAE